MFAVAAFVTGIIVGWVAAGFVCIYMDSKS